MLSIDKPGKGSDFSGYYWNYYISECIEAAYWYGGGAEILELEGEVQRRSFEHLLAGRDPDEKFDLVKNAGHPDRDTHWDLCFSAPKSVSVLYALASDEVRQRILEAHKAAVQKALEHFEKNHAITRRGQGGKIREHCKIVASCFTHNVSRENDMQLHTHAIVKNVGFRADGSTGALHSIECFRHKLEIGAVYQKEFARGLERDFNLVVEKEKVGFHIQGVPKELCRENSTRRQQIEAVLEKEGLKGGAVSSQISDETRRSKERISQAELFKGWREKCESFGWGQKEAAQLIEERRIAHQHPQNENVRSNEKLRTVIHGDSKNQNAEQPKKEQTEQTQNASEKKISERSNSGENRQTQSGAEKPKNQQTKSREQNQENQTSGVKAGQSQSDEKKTKQSETQGQTGQESKSTNQSQEKAGTKNKKPNAKAEKKKKQKEYRKKIKAFRKDLRKAVDRIYIENQTVEKVMRIANRLARVHGVNTDEMFKAVKGLKLPKKILWGMARLEHRKLFRKAPNWSPFSKIRLPVIALCDPARKWGTIEKKVVLVRFAFHQHEFRIQQRYLVPRAPKWSPLHKISLPALRFVAKRAPFTPKIKFTDHQKQDSQKQRHER